MMVLGWSIRWRTVCLSSSQVLHINGVLRCGKHSIVAQCRFGARTETLQVLVRRDALALSEILQENIDVALEAGDVVSVRRQERVNGHLAVGSLEKVPSDTSELDAFRERNGLAISAPCARERSVVTLRRSGKCGIETNLAMGPALKLPSQTISSYSSGPSGALLVNASYATLVTKFCPV